MRYLSLYKSVETGPPTPAEMERMGALIQKWMAAGALLGAEGCLPSARGMRVRLADGKITVTDGPFTESKEVIGGFAILEAQSKHQVLELIKEFMQVAGDGECEVRELHSQPAV
jgi:hypothetical protein